MPLVLSLFPGIGLLDMAFEQEGFCVVRGPDLLWGGDVKRFHPPAGRFDGVIGGPPCQAFSRLRALVMHNANKRRGLRGGLPDDFKPAENLIPEFCRVIAEAQPRWFVMENVPQAPLPVVEGYYVDGQTFDNRWLGEEQSRKRLICWGTRGAQAVLLHIESVALQNAIRHPAVLAAGGRPVPVRIVGSGKVKSSHRAAQALRHATYQSGAKTESYFREACRLQGLPDDFDLPSFTVAGKVKAVGNGVPIPMGRAVARAVKAALAGGVA